MSPDNGKSFWRTSTGAIWGGFVILGLVLLIGEHRLHALGALSGLVAAACIALFLAARRSARGARHE